MPIRAGAVGSELQPHTERVTVRRILAFAAGIGQTEESVFDDARQSGITAPPTFCVALEWPVVSHPGARGQLGAIPEELRRGVHASQDSIFHRPIRPGDHLTTRGRLVAIRATRAGALVTTRLETRDSRTGALVVESFSASIYRGVEVAGEGSSEAEAPPLVTSSISAAPRRATVAIPRQLPHLYSESAQIWNPIHTERRIALAAGLPDIILHGTATWALAGRELVRAYLDGDPARLRRLHGRFVGMVIPGGELTLEHALSDRGSDRGVVEFEVRNQAEETVLAEGVARLGRD